MSLGSVCPGLDEPLPDPPPWPTEREDPPRPCGYTTAHHGHVWLQVIDAERIRYFTCSGVAPRPVREHPAWRAVRGLLEDVRLPDALTDEVIAAVIAVQGGER